MGVCLPFLWLCWTVIALIELKQVAEYRRKLSRFSAVEKALLQEAEGSQFVRQ